MLQADDSCLETDRGSSGESREETPDSDSGYNAGAAAAADANTSAASPKSAGPQKPRPVQIAHNFTPQQQGSHMIGNIAVRPIADRSNVISITDQSEIDPML